MCTRVQIGNKFIPRPGGLVVGHPPVGAHQRVGTQCGGHPPWWVGIDRGFKSAKTFLAEPLSKGI